MIRLFEAADSVQRFCREQRWHFCIIRGLALQRWGEPRLTQDIDIELFTGFGGESEVIRTLLERFDSRIENASEFELQRRVLLLRTKAGIGIDRALGALPFEESAVRRATFFSFTPEISCSPVAQVRAYGRLLAASGVLKDRRLRCVHPNGTSTG